MAFMIFVPEGKTIEISGPLQLSVKGDAVPVIAITRKEATDDDQATRGGAKAGSGGGG